MSKASYVIGIPIDFDNIDSFDPRLLSDKETYEYYQEHKEECFIFEDIKDFFADLNEDRVDTENNFWLHVEIDEDML